VGEVDHADDAVDHGVADGDQAAEQRHRSTLNLSLASFNCFRPGVFNVWLNVKTGDELFHQVSSLGGRQGEHFGLEFFNGGGHGFLPMESSDGCRVP
jgi:hypothetical protein